MKMEHRVIAANLTSWMATILSLEFLKDALQVLALLGSIGVSVASIWWIKRQAAALKRKEDESQKPPL